MSEAEATFSWAMSVRVSIIGFELKVKSSSAESYSKANSRFSTLDLLG